VSNLGVAKDCVYDVFCELEDEKRVMSHREIEEQIEEIQVKIENLQYCIKGAKRLEKRRRRKIPQ
jgi:hypothetical protein